MLILLLSIAAGLAVHLLSIALAAHLVGVRIRVISFGLGPTLVSTGIFRLCAIPLGGYVKLKDSREEPVLSSEMSTAFDGRSTVEQMAISLAGCAMLVLLSFSLLGREGLAAFLMGPVQIFRGAFAPFSEAQAFIAESLRLPNMVPPKIVVAYAAAKMAAMNILPLPALNGGEALAILGRGLKIESWWSPSLTKALMFVMVSIALSWCAAGIVYATSA